MNTEELAKELVQIAKRLRDISYAVDFTDPRQSASSTALDIAAQAVTAAAYRFDAKAAERAMDEAKS